MANQYEVLVEEATRGTDPGSGYLFPPCKGKIEPEPDYQDQKRSEFRGQDTRLGDVNDSRVSTSWKHTLETWAYPIKDIMVPLKHVFGFAGTRTVVEVTGYKGMLYPPAAAPYATGGALVGKAIGIIPNTDKDGTTVAQKFLGGRPTSMKLSIKRPDDVDLSIEFMGGPWVGAPGQTATAGASFTTLNPFNSADAVCYVGTGITRTGTPPDITAIAPGSMVQFAPDSFELEISNGIKDEDRLNGLKGPSVTVVDGQVSAKIKYTMDFSDPAAGFSSYDEYVLYCANPLYHAYLIKLKSSDLAGNATQYHEWWFDLPRQKMTVKVISRDATGKPAKVEFSGESRYDATAKYPVGMFTYDKVSAY